MGEVKIWSHNVSVTFYWLTSLSFHVNWPSHSWDATFSKSDLENPSKVKVMEKVNIESHNMGPTFYHSHPFLSMSISHPIHKLRLFQNLTLKNHGQGHGWGEHLKSQQGCNTLSTHIPFIPCQSVIPLLVWLFQNVTLKIQGQGHGWGQSWKSQSGCNILSTHIPLVTCQSALSFLRYSIFKIKPWKSKVKVMGEVDIESHNMDPTFYRLTSF